MMASVKVSIPVRHLQRFAIITTIVWTLIIILGVTLHLYEIYRNTLDLARIQAAHSFEKDVVYRRWAAGHGGVYVPPTEATPPNPYLTEIENRDVTTSSGQQLTLVNPAYMTRQVHELGRLEFGHQSHITSLDPVRPENAADAWESLALKAFEQGAQEVTELSMIGDLEYLRLMRPLITEKACLTCHQSQGYVEGDLRGGISVSVPMAPLWTVMHHHMINDALGYGLIWLLGLGGIGFSAARMVRSMRAREVAVDHLGDVEASMNSLFRAAPIGIGIVSNRVLQKVNQHFCETLGYTGEELIGKNSRLLYPSDAEYEYVGREKYRQIKERGTGMVETRMQCKDGRLIDVLLSSTPLNPADLAAGVTFTVLDITDRKQAERELQRNETRLRTLLETLPDLVWLKDPDGVYLLCNQKFERFFGAKESEIVGKTDYDFFDKALAEHFRGHDRAALAAGGPRINEEAVTYADDGHREILETIKTPMFDADGRPIGVLGIARDITERKQAQQALQKSEARYRGVVEDSPVLICRFLPDGEISYANKAYCDYFASSPQELVGSNFLTLIPESERGAVMANISALTADAPTQSHEHRVIAPGGEIRWQRWTNRALPDEQGEISAYQSIGEDITELKQQLEELRRWQDITLGREGRVLELKQEVNRLLQELGREARYANQDEVDDSQG